MDPSASNAPPSLSPPQGVRKGQTTLQAQPRSVPLHESFDTLFRSWASVESSETKAVKEGESTPTNAFYVATRLFFLPTQSRQDPKKFTHPFYKTAFPAEEQRVPDELIRRRGETPDSIPGVYWKKVRKERVVVSSGEGEGQEQFVDVPLPDLQVYSVDPTLLPLALASVGYPTPMPVVGVSRPILSFYEKGHERSYLQTILSLLDGTRKEIGARLEALGYDPEAESATQPQGTKDLKEKDTALEWASRRLRKDLGEATEGLNAAGTTIPQSLASVTPVLTNEIQTQLYGPPSSPDSKEGVFYLIVETTGKQGGELVREAWLTRKLYVSATTGDALAVAQESFPDPFEGLVPGTHPTYEPKRRMPITSGPITWYRGQLFRYAGTVPKITTGVYLPDLFEPVPGEDETTVAEFPIRVVYLESGPILLWKTGGGMREVSIYLIASQAGIHLTEANDRVAAFNHLDTAPDVLRTEFLQKTRANASKAVSLATTQLATSLPLPLLELIAEKKDALPIFNVVWKRWTQEKLTRFEAGLGIKEWVAAVMQHYNELFEPDSIGVPIGETSSEYRSVLFSQTLRQEMDEVYVTSLFLASYDGSLGVVERQPLLRPFSTYTFLATKVIQTVNVRSDTTRKELHSVDGDKRISSLLKTVGKGFKKGLYLLKMSSETLLALVRTVSPMGLVLDAAASVQVVSKKQLTRGKARGTLFTVCVLGKSKVYNRDMKENVVLIDPHVRNAREVGVVKRDETMTLLQALGPGATLSGFVEGIKNGWSADPDRPNERNVPMFLTVHEVYSLASVSPEEGERLVAANENPLGQAAEARASMIESVQDAIAKRRAEEAQAQAQEPIFD